MMVWMWFCFLRRYRRLDSGSKRLIAIAESVWAAVYEHLETTGDILDIHLETTADVLPIYCALPIDDVLRCTFEAGDKTAKELAAEISALPSDAGEQFAACFCVLGWMYHYGEGVPQNNSDALKWRTRAAELGHADAQYFVGIMTQHARKYCAALKWFTSASKQEHKYAQYKLGTLLYNGAENVVRDRRQAVYWLVQAAKQGFVSAQFDLGSLPTLPKEQRIRWLTEAVKQNHSMAMLKLSELVEDPELRAKYRLEAAHDFETEDFNSPDDLEHGDAVMGCFGAWVGHLDMGLRVIEHWALYDKDYNRFIELTGDNGRENVPCEIVTRDFRWWVSKWTNRKKVVWKDPYMRRQRATGVMNARQRIGDTPTYSLLPEYGDENYLACETFVRLCYSGIARTTQEERLTLGAPYVHLFNAVLLNGMLGTWFYPNARKQKSMLLVLFLLLALYPTLFWHSAASALLGCCVCTVNVLFCVLAKSTATNASTAIAILTASCFVYVFLPAFFCILVIKPAPEFMYGVWMTYVYNSIYDVVITKPFKSTKQLKHGDAVLVDIIFGMAYHWAIYDKEHDEFVELTRGDDGAKIVNCSATDWMEKRKDQKPKRVLWKSLFMASRREEAIARAREKIGTSPHYTLLAKFRDESSMNCESFVRWSYTGTPESFQTRRFRFISTVVLLLTVAMMCVKYYHTQDFWWGSRAIIVLVSTLVLPVVVNLILSPVFQSHSK